MKPSTKLVFDANFLMTPGLFGVDVFSEIKRLIDVDFEIMVPDKVIAELKTLSKKGNLKERKAAKIGLELSKDLKIVELPGLKPDDSLLGFSRKGWIICTNDKYLKNRIFKEGGKVIYLRMGGYLELRGGVLGLS